LADTERTRAGEITGAHFVRLKTIDAIDANVRLLIRYGCLALVAYFSYGSIAVLAGKHTFADIGIRFLGDIKIANSVGYVVGLGGVAYGRQQKKLRGNAIQSLSKRVKELEAEIDQGRSSSGITERGETRPEDKL
jgi:hypothetical protein